MKIALEILGDLSAVIAALLWFGSASVRLKERDALTRGLGTGFADDPRALLLMIYKQSRWNAGAAIAAGIAALLAIIVGLIPGS
jgi:hypothetical protein